MRHALRPMRYPLGNSNFICFTLVLSTSRLLRSDRFRLVVFLVKIWLAQDLL
jgi:hypothetical protein